MREMYVGSEDLLSRSGRYQQINMLGEGAFSPVFQARDAQAGRWVALKPLPPLNDGAKAKILSDFEGLRGIDHLNVARYYNLHFEGNRGYLCMELIPGKTILDYIRPPHERGIKLPSMGIVLGQNVSATGHSEYLAMGPEARRRLRICARQMAAGLQCLHRAGVIHQDFTPNNVLVTPTGRVALIDYGFELSLFEEEAQESIIGTATYMSPEQGMNAEPARPESDWYGFGVVLFEALTGSPPFTGSGYEVMLRKQSVMAPDPRNLSAGVPEDLAQLCVELLDRTPERRPRGEEVMQRLL